MKPRNYILVGLFLGVGLVALIHMLPTSTVPPKTLSLDIGNTSQYYCNSTTAEEFSGIPVDYYTNSYPLRDVETIAFIWLWDGESSQPITPVAIRYPGSMSNIVDLLDQAKQERATVRLDVTCEPKQPVWKLTSLTLR